MSPNTNSPGRLPFPPLNSSRSYWLTRFLILRLLGVVYAVAFLTAINQVRPLIGSDGLLPANLFLQQVKNALGSASAGFMRLPSLFWISHSDNALLFAAWTGLLLSLVMVAGYANVPLLSALWMLYLSFVHIGQEWYGYGWEIQLTETGFLAIFLCPLLDGRPFPKRAPPFAVIVLFRWLVCRIMLGAGLIKLRGDQIWRKGTALYYHFETQPLPGPLSRWFHFLPRVVLRAGVWFNWIAELAAPVLVFWPRIARLAAGTIIILFQLALMLSGNLSFLNWLTIVPALACFDDDFLAKLLPAGLVQKAKLAKEKAVPSRAMLTTGWIIAALVALLSIQPLANLMSPRQVMNTSYDPLELVNTYGAFGSVGEQRMNVVFEGTLDSPPGNSAKWRQYIYKGLPVNVFQRPPQVAPYQLRLDWQMWFASMSTPEDYPWVYNLIWKLLHNDPRAKGLFAATPFGNRPPKFIRAILYTYSFARPGNSSHHWWNRSSLGLWIQPLSIRDTALARFVKSEGWTQQADAASDKP